MIIEAAHGVAESFLRMQGFRRERVCGVSAFRGGNGPPMVLLHGALSRGSTTWGLVAGRLARHFDVIAPDLPGFGGSALALAPERVTVRSVAGALLEVMPEWTGGGRCALVGGSLGGWVAARMALERPSQVGRLVLVDAAGFWRDEAAARGLADLITPETREALEELYGRVLGRRRLPGFVARDVLRSYRRDYGAMRNLIGAAEGDVLTEADLRGIMHPAHVVWGEGDTLIPPEVGRDLAAAIPGATLDVLPGCAHVPQVEAAGRFVDVVLRRLANG